MYKFNKIYRFIGIFVFIFLAFSIFNLFPSSDSFKTPAEAIYVSDMPEVKTENYQKNLKLKTEIGVVNLKDCAIYSYIENDNDIVLSCIKTIGQGSKTRYQRVFRSSYGDFGFSNGNSDSNSGDLFYDRDNYNSQSIKNYKVVYGMRLSDGKKVYINGKQTEQKVFKVTKNGKTKDMEIWCAMIGKNDLVSYCAEK